MSEIRDTLSDVIAERASVFGDQFTNLRTGTKFWAEVSDQGYLALVGALSKDLREKIKFWPVRRVLGAFWGLRRPSPILRKDAPFPCGRRPGGGEGGGILGTQEWP